MRSEVRTCRLTPPPLSPGTCWFTLGLTYPECCEFNNFKSRIYLSIIYFFLHNVHVLLSNEMNKHLLRNDFDLRPCVSVFDGLMLFVIYI